MSTTTPSIAPLVGAHFKRTTTPSATASVVGALAKRAFRDARTRTIAFAYMFALYAYIQPAGYRHTYPTLADREAFAHSFAGNDALRLFYGYPYDPTTVSGYSAWRVGGTLAIAAAVFGVLAAVRALRTEEDTGRAELVLAGRVGRGTSFLSAMAAIAVGVVILWAAETAGFVAAGLPLGGSAYLALATASIVPVFVSIGALVSQLAPTRRVALELGSATVALFLLLRVVADTSAGLAWLRWATPLGWAEELRPFAGPQSLALLLPALATVALLALAARIAATRDIGTGVLPAHDSADPNLRLLGGPAAQALRAERGTLVAWATGIGVFALILGMVSASISSAGISKSIREEIAKLSSGSIATPSGYLAFVFIFFIVVVSLFVCAQIGATRREESEQQLETLLALPVSRGRWLGGRLLLACAGALALSLLAGLLAWAGASSQGVDVSLAKMLEAGANCLPVALLFGGIAALAYALVPRASTGIAYGLVVLAFLWQLVGSLLGVPKWLVEVTPFAHVGLVPTQSFRGGVAAVMLAIAAAAGAGALWAFGRRDTVGQ
jgi:ABC-2 type transport system permease protein